MTKWAGAAVRMGQQGGQTEALWTHLDPSKPQERLHAPAGAHARSAATCHNHTEQEASDHLHLQLKTTFSVKTTFRKEKKRERIIKRSALLLSICPMNAIPRCSLGGAVFGRPTDVAIGIGQKILKKKWTFWSFVKKHFHASQVMLVSAKVFGAIVCF